MSGGVGPAPRTALAPRTRNGDEVGTSATAEGPAPQTALGPELAEAPACPGKVLAHSWVRLSSSARAPGVNRASRYEAFA